MSIDTIVNEDSYVSDGSLTPRSIPFPFASVGHIVVTVDGAARTLNATYQISGTYPSATLVPLAGFATNGATVRMRRRTPATQDYDIVGPALNAAALESTLDRSAMAVLDVTRDVANFGGRALLVPDGETAGPLPSLATRLFKYLGFDGEGKPVAVPGTVDNGLLQTLLASSSGAGMLGWISAGTGAIARTIQDLLRERPVHPKNFGCKADGVTNDTVNMIKAAVFAAANGRRLKGNNESYLISLADMTVPSLEIDNMTWKEANPNTGDPVTAKITASVTGQGYLKLGRGFKIDRSGNGLAGTLNVSAGIHIIGFDIVDFFAEVTGNARGSGVIADYVTFFNYAGNVHDMLCDHSGVSDDIQHGTWARYCENVITDGIVRNLGSITRTTVARYRYNRGHAYSGCENIFLRGVVSEVDQGFDVTGNARGGNTSANLCGAHAAYCYSSAYKFANAAIGISGACATATEFGLCAVLLSGPSVTGINMTSGGIISGITAIGGGANGVWPDVSVIKLDRNSSSAPESGYPKGITITDNVRVDLNGNATTFTVGSTTTLQPTPSGALNIHRGARVRMTTTGTLPTGLALATDYYVTIREDNFIQLSTSFINCLDGVFISTFSGGSGTHTMTAQNDCDWGIYSNVDSYDGLQPNLVYGNRFGSLANSPLVVPYQATATQSGYQSPATTSGATLRAKASSEVDPYGLCSLSGGTDSGVRFTALLAGTYELVATGLWEGGAGTGGARVSIAINAGGTGSFVTQEAGSTQGPYFSADFRQTARWSGFVSRNTTFEIPIFQTDGTRNFQLREAVFRLVETA